MCSKAEVRSIIGELCIRLRTIFPNDTFDVILFGSYSKNTEEDGSDIDVMILVDEPRRSIAEKSWQIGEVAADLLMEYGVVVSPIVENREYFTNLRNILPFYQSIQREGVRIGA